MYLKKEKERKIKNSEQKNYLEICGCPGNGKFDKQRQVMPSCVPGKLFLRKVNVWADCVRPPPPPPSE